MSVHFIWIHLLTFSPGYIITPVTGNKRLVPQFLLSKYLIRSINRFVSNAEYFTTKTSYTIKYAF